LLNNASSKLTTCSHCR